MHDEEAKKVKLKDTPIGSEFLDAFPKELHGLSLKRKIKFYINLVP